MLRLQQMDQSLIFLDSKKARIFSGEKKNGRNSVELLESQVGCIAVVMQWSHKILESGTLNNQDF